MSRLVFLITDLYLGGTPRVLRDLALGLREKQFTVRVISVKPLPPDSGVGATIPAQLRSAGISVDSLGMTSARHGAGAMARLVGLLNEFQPDIVYAMLIHANALATAALPFAKARPAFIQSIHTLQEEPEWHWTLEGVIAPFADGLIVPAKPILERIARYGNFRYGAVIANGIDIDRFARAAALPAEEVPWPKGVPVVGYVGRFDPVKNLPLLLEAFARLRRQGVGRGGEAHLAMVGYGAEEGGLRGRAAALGIAPLVHFVGPTTAPERWYKSFSVACLPSAVEGFGLLLVEAMAAGVPVVGIRTRVTEGIVRDGVDGRLAAGGGSEFSLAAALQEVISDWPPAPLSPTAAHLSTLCYLRGAFSVERMVELHVEFFKNL